jgi:hypothetical protein
MSKPFEGFTIPTGAWMPPELLQLMPHIKTLGALKVLIVALAELSQPGHAPQPLSINHLAERTGLGRQAVIAARRAITQYCTTTADSITLITKGGYENHTTPSPPVGAQPRHTPTPSGGYDDHTPVVADTPNLLTKKQQQQLKKLQEFGIMTHVAQPIVLDNDPNTIDRYLNFARNARWASNRQAVFVAAIRGRWDTPIIAPPTTWYSDEDLITR